MPKPVVNTTWCTSGANTTAPSEEQRLNGWKPNEIPTSDVLNYYQNAVGQITEYLESQDFEAPTTFRAASESTYTPLTAGLDPNNSIRRATIDHNGFRMGRVTDFREHWFSSGGVEPYGWIVTGGGSVSYDDPKTDMPYRIATLSTTNAPSNSVSLLSVPLLYHSDDTTLVVEWDVKTGVIDGEGSVFYRGGIQFSHSAAWNFHAAFDFNPTESEFVQFVVVGGGATIEDTDVEITANTVYRLRLEVVGASNHAGSNKLYRFFINGSAVVSLVSSTITSDFVRIAHTLDNGINDPNDAYSFYVGEIRASWNHGSANDGI